MIILDGEADGQTKEDTYNGLTLRHPQAAFTRSTSPLPDYDTSEAQHWKAIAEPPPSRWKVDPRYWKAGLYALAIYVLLSIVIVIPILVWKARKESHPPSNFWTLGPTPSLWAVESSNLPTPFQISTGGSTASDLNRTCNVWYTISSSENLAKARFSLAPTGLITIRSNISYNTLITDQLKGGLSVSMNKDYDEDDVEFTLDMKYSSEQLRQRIDVCFSRTGSNRGLSIYIPKDFDDGDHLEFQINVVLPRVKSTVDFMTYLPQFSQSFGDLRSKLTFDRFAVEGATYPISCKFIEASQIWVKNIAAPIDGTFNATAALTLDAIKGSITTDIFLTRPNLPVRPTLLTLDTGDSPINANITLDSSETTEWSKGSPGFVALVKTFNAPLNLDITLKDNVPVSPLQLQVQNNLAQTSVSLDSYYEGSFSVQTKMSQVFVKDTAQSPRDDPANAGRLRTLAYDPSSEARASGWVGWGFKPMGNHACQSYVEIVSALSPVTLTFGPG